MSVGARITAIASEICEQYHLDLCSDEELASMGEDGLLVLLSRYCSRIEGQAGAAYVGAAAREDLTQAAYLGFLEALQTHDSSYGASPYTHAYPYIQREVSESNRTMSPKPARQRAHSLYWRAMRVCGQDPVRARAWVALQRETGWALQEMADGGDETARQVLDDRKAQWQSQGDDVTARMAEYGYGMSPADFDGIYQAVTYLDAPVDTAGSQTGYDLMGGEEQGYADVDTDLFIEAMMGCLTPREAHVVAGVYGVGCDEMSVSDLADELGISERQVRRVRQGAEQKLRQAS